MDMMIRRGAVALFFMLAASARAEDEYRIPYEALTDAQARLVREVAERHHLTTEFARERVKSTLPTYDYLLDRLPITARMVRALGLGKYVIKPVDEQCLVLDDRDGVKVSLYLIHRAPGLRVYYTKGYYRGPLIPRIYGRAVIVLRYRQDGDAIDTSAKLYFRIDNGIVRAMSNVFRSIVLGIARDKGAIFVQAASQIAVRVAADAEGLYQELSRSGRMTEEDLAEYRASLLGESSLK